MIYSIVTSTAPFYGVCIKIDYKGYEISISCDSSCAAGKKILTRTELRVYQGNSEVTKRFFNVGNDIFRPDISDICLIKQKIDDLTSEVA
jgi:hypothetical protein